MVTHPTTNLPAHGLSTAERTGSPVFHVLWSIAKEMIGRQNIFFENSESDYPTLCGRSNRMRNSSRICDTWLEGLREDRYAGKKEWLDEMLELYI